MAAGFDPYLLTMMFVPLGGSEASRAPRMMDAAERLYATFVTRVARRPAASSSVSRLPVMVGALDLPVHKRTGKKLSRAEVLVNGGLHLHAVLLVPPRSRLRTDAVEHFRANQGLYVPNDSLVRRVDVRPIDGEVGLVADYVLKMVRRGRLPYDTGLLVLPRALSELSRGAAPNHRQRSSEATDLSPTPSALRPAVHFQRMLL